MPPFHASPSEATAVVVAGVIKSWGPSLMMVLLCFAALRLVVYNALALLRRPRGGIDPDFQPPVTIIVPAFNEETVIANCLRSLLRSDYWPLSILVVDDGSTDRTSQVVRELASEEPRIRLQIQPNGGKWSAINRALALIDTPIFVVADADSMFLPDTVRWLVQDFRDERVGAVAGVVEVGNRGSLLTSLQNLEYVVSQSVFRRAQEMIEGIGVVPGAIGAWRTEAVRRAGLMSEDTITEDADLTVAVHRAGYRVRMQENARSVTEAPEVVKAFMRQRLRWTFGMLQVAWKHKRATLEGRPVSIVTLTDSVWLSCIGALMAPFVDLFF
jgi:cellulose synthase/poly-beta-1,6-N-acetylglucosamine synthase-like glycosyltransferase